MLLKFGQLIAEIFGGHQFGCNDLVEFFVFGLQPGVVWVGCAIGLHEQSLDYLVDFLQVVRFEGVHFQFPLFVVFEDGFGDFAGLHLHLKVVVLVEINQHRPNPLAFLPADALVFCDCLDDP